ncbi:MAG: glycosyltransferase, partial [Zoogloeaceae bacterium]|nr:glycosyltransferase [Zoogloeaceae bacterium]
RREDVVYLGSLPHSDTALLFNALDIGVIYLKDTPFGRYCFPQKAYEMLACRLPVVAADVGAMPALFDDPRNLYHVDDEASLAQAILANLEAPAVSDREIRDWKDVVGDLEYHLRTVRAKAAPS